MQIQKNQFSQQQNLMLIAAIHIYDIIVNMKTINVVAAIIIKSNQILATQRGYGNYAGFWEFPGGKIENGESPEQAIIREIKEELSADIVVDSFLTEVEHDYPEFHLKMKCFLCHIKDGKIELLEHSALKWLDKNNLDSVEWLPADFPVLAKLSNVLM